MELNRYRTEQLDYPGDGLHYLNGVPFTGIIESRSPNGRLDGETEYRDGLLSGRKRSWHPAGGLQFEAECAGGVYHGTVREWHEDGRQATDAVYEHGIRLRTRSWDEAGNLVEHYSLSESDPAFELLLAVRAAEKAHAAGGGGAEPGAPPDRGGIG